MYWTSRIDSVRHEVNAISYRKAVPALLGCIMAKVDRRPACSLTAYGFITYCSLSGEHEYLSSDTDTGPRVDIFV